MTTLIQKLIILHVIHGLLDKTNLKRALYLCTYLNLMPCPSFNLMAIKIDGSVNPFPHAFNGPPEDQCVLKTSERIHRVRL